MYPTEAIGVEAQQVLADVGRTTDEIAAAEATLHAAVLGPIRNRAGGRKREAVGRDAVLSIAADGRHAGAGWYEEWLDGLRRDGSLTRIVCGGLCSARW
ncbi:hypothetical protein [Micromonospora sp. NPDC048898]|uniref:hypothetical protein n=1 Tax=Micromonospora sp. NPDC048898 TaxID=3364260 RepID=UPI003710F1D2